MITPAPREVIGQGTSGTSQSFRGALQKHSALVFRCSAPHTRGFAQKPFSTQYVLEPAHAILMGKRVAGSRWLSYLSVTPNVGTSPCITIRVLTESVNPRTKNRCFTVCLSYRFSILASGYFVIAPSPTPWAAWRPRVLWTHSFLGLQLERLRSCRFAGSRRPRRRGPLGGCLDLPVPERSALVKTRGPFSRGKRPL